MNLIKENATHTQKSNLTAYISQPEPPFSISIPEKYLIPLIVAIIGFILTFLIPTFYKVLNERRQRTNLQSLNTTFDHLLFTSKNKNQKLDFDRFLKTIENNYLHDKISKDHYDMIKDKLSRYTKEFE